MLVIQKLYEQEYSQNTLPEQLKGISIAERYEQSQQCGRTQGQFAQMRNCLCTNSTQSKRLWKHYHSQ